MPKFKKCPNTHCKHQPCGHREAHIEEGDCYNPCMGLDGRYRSRLSCRKLTKEELLIVGY